MLLLAVSSRGFNVPEMLGPINNPPGMSRFNAGQSFTTVTPGRRATRLLLADSYPIVMRVLSHVISPHHSDALSPLQCAHAMYPRPRHRGNIDIRNGHRNTGVLAKWLLRCVKHGAGSTIEVRTHLYATLAGFIDPCQSQMPSLSW
ncbi:uncharacterized protein Triagg1_4077 [Trichoderma aggressivum f. europaeum]|uniref:Uncharacterized protein n=1 Tax=Trichoderma aggressivum f. europaeum TaxID=173218 RepID=A0AAE1M0S9_9HYPO|nr:hypothetical protein Triagg1_4077 [Trichoderma aggressivum f. europaeum]